jgi:hypothetical protein
MDRIIIKSLLLNQFDCCDEQLNDSKNSSQEKASKDR